MKKQPEITEKTRRKFVDAFWSLAKEKPIGKIAVSELTRRAGYNRSTFYEYFVDTDDLLAYAENKLLEEIKQTILTAMAAHDSPCTVFDAVFTAMNEEIYLLIGPNGDSSFIPRVRAELLPIIETYFPIPKDVANFDYLGCYVNAVLFGILQHWNDKGKDLSVKEISALMQELVLHGLMSRITHE